jgi:hypothetical protein
MYIGIIAGLLIPLFSLLVFNLTAFEDMSIGEFVKHILSRGKLSSVLSLGVISNLLVFFIFIWLNYLYSARGVVAATLVYGLLIVLSKFL